MGESQGSAPSRGVPRSWLAAGAVLLALLPATIIVAPASAEPLVYGAIAIRDSTNQLVPGVEVLIRSGACATGAPVWQANTASRADAYGAFAFSLAPGLYCAETMAVPGSFQRTAPQEFTVTSRKPAWKTIWIPGSAPVSYIGVVAARNAYSQPIPGVRIQINQGVCGSDGRAVWDAITPARSDAYGAFAFSLPGGQYCLSTPSTPASYTPAQSADLTLSNRDAQTSVNLWLHGEPSTPAATGAGSTDASTGGGSTPPTSGCVSSASGSVGSAPGAVSGQGVAGTTSDDLASFASDYNAIRIANCLESIPYGNFRYDSCMEARLFWMAESPSPDPLDAWGHMGSVRIDGVPSTGCDGNLAGGSGNTGATVAQKWWVSDSHRASLYRPGSSIAGACIAFAMSHGGIDEPALFVRSAARWTTC